MNNLIYKLKKSDFADKITLIVAMVLLVVLFGALNRNYVTGANMINILIACSLTGFVAIGETNLIIANQNDLSAGSVAACAGVLAAISRARAFRPILALAIAVCAGFLVGAVNAGLVTFLKLQPFIATLATMSVVRGIAYILCNGKAVAISDKTFIKFGNYRIFGILPVPGPASPDCLHRIRHHIEQDVFRTQHLRARRQHLRCAPGRTQPDTHHLQAAHHRIGACRFRRRAAGRAHEFRAAVGLQRA